jgi:hypothetical protein
MEQHSEKVVTWRLGLALFRSSSLQEGNHAFSGLANGVILIYGSSLFTARELSFLAPSATDIVSGPGSTDWNFEKSGALVLLPWLTNLPELPGQF